MTTAVVAPVDTPDAAGPGGRAERAIARRALRQVGIGAAVCAVAFGGTAASSALSYVTTFPTEASRQAAAAATSASSGMAVLLGPAGGIDTVGGYTVYKGFVFLTTIGAIWALLAATRLLRGEEDSGRWQLVLAGSTRPASATAATLAALGVAVLLVGLGSGLITALAGLNPDVGFGPGASLFYGVSLVVPAAAFVGVGAVTSQLWGTRRAATAMAMVVFGVLFAVRMVADAGPGTRWLLWCTPFGWTELMQAFTAPDLRPLGLAVVVAGVLAATATALSARRDLGAGILSSRDSAALRPFGLRSATGVYLRVELGVLVAWCVGAFASGLLYGVVSKLTTSDALDTIGDTLDKFGGEGPFVKQYFGVAFLITATVVALLPAGQLGAASDEEASGRLVHVLAGTTRRRSWFAGRLAVTAAVVVVAGVVAGFGCWLGAVTQGVDIDLGTLVGAGLNVVPTALVTLGLGAVVLAVAPRAASTTVYVVVIWSLLVDILASMVTSVSWLKQTSLFHYMALAPGQTPEARTVLLTLALALALAALATALFERRDIAGG